MKVVNQAIYGSCYNLICLNLDQILKYQILKDLILDRLLNYQSRQTLG